MKLHWVDYWDNRVMAGRLFGYTASANFLRMFLLGEGVELTEEGTTALHYCHPFLYRPIRGKINLIFTMHESTDPEPEFLAAFEQAHGIITPSTFCRDVFRKWQRRTPVRVSPLGYSDWDYPFHERARPEVVSGSIEETCNKLLWYIDQLESKMVRGNVIPKRPYKPINLLQKIEPLVLEEPFVYLYNGAPNARKGWPRVVSAWSHFFDELPWCTLVAKTSQATGEGKISHMNNVMVDTRRYPLDGMRTLLHESHCAVLPSLGEGFGLVNLEALGTGLPLITSRWSGHLDFCNDENSFFTTHTMGKVEQGLTNKNPLTAAIPDITSVGREMIRVFMDYDEALRRGRNGYELVSKNFTWKNAAVSLIQAIKELEQRR